MSNSQIPVDATTLILSVLKHLFNVNSWKGKRLLFSSLLSEMSSLDITAYYKEFE